MSKINISLDTWIFLVGYWIFKNDTGYQMPDAGFTICTNKF